MKLFSLGVIVTNVMAMSMVLLLVASSSTKSVDAFSGVVNQQTRTLTRTTRQPSQQPSSLLPPMAYLIREGADVDVDVDALVVDGNINDNEEDTLTLYTPTPSATIIPTTTTGTINLNNYVDEMMIEDLQDQHLQMMQMQQQVQQQQLSLYNSVPMPLLPQILLPSARTTATIKFTSATTTMNKNKNDNVVGIYDRLHDDLNQINIRLLRSKVSFIRRLLPQIKKQYIERFVDFLIKFVL